MVKFNKDKLQQLKNSIDEKPKHTILLVDDEESNIAVMSSILVDDYNILTAHNGQQGLDLLASLQRPEDVSLVISDQRMPNMSGTQFLEKIRKIIPKTIRIIVTGYIDSDAMINSINNAQIYKFILKPYERTDFLWTINRAIEAFDMQKALDEQHALQLAEKEREIASQKKIQELKQTALDASESSNKLKDDFLRMISHELRTPLNGIQGSLSLSLTEFLSDELEYLLNTAQDSTHELTAIIDKTLYFTELQAGKVELHESATNFHQLMENIFQKYQHTALAKSLAFSLDIDKEIPANMDCDNDKISFIIEELIANALTFTQQGLVAIRANYVTESDTNKIAIIVNDSGPGISEEQQASIFDAFNQLDSSYKREVYGIGMGLSICRHLAKILDGNILINSKPKFGCSFTLLLPCIPSIKQTTPSNNHKKSTSNTSQLPELNILIVEDNKTNQMILKKILAQHKHHVATADNGQLALEYLSNHLVDCIFMDCQMPVMDGFEATKNIRLMNNENRNSLIIAITANLMDYVKNSCISSGMNDFLKKPILPNSIHSMLSKHFPL